MSPYQDGDDSAALPLWREPISAFGSYTVTVLDAVHMCWTCHPAWPADRIDARSPTESLAVSVHLLQWRYVVLTASDPTVTSHAGVNRLLRTEPQVQFQGGFAFMVERLLMRLVFDVGQSRPASRKL